MAKKVAQAQVAVLKTIKLTEKHTPTYLTAEEIKFPASQIMEGHMREDPQTTPQLAVPIAVPEECFWQDGWYKSNSFEHTVGGLALIPFLCLL